MTTSLKALGAVCGALSCLLTGPPATPVPPSVERPSPCQADVARAVAEQLAKAPDGRFVPPDTVSYDDGAEVITFRPPSCGPARRGAEHDCDEDGVPGNAVCLYDRRAYEGSRQAIKVPGTRRIDGIGLFMSLRNDRPFVFLVKRNRDEEGACFPGGSGYGNLRGVADRRWVNAHPSLRECPGR
ncbi:hypothetical protein [Streptosporangium sp. NPDC020145]|uniref:hypothetical protein n=1 Tax=Streptosporangium sp. NPDC020145 TaxID=3154694 RepID=UPI00343B8D9B